MTGLGVIVIPKVSASYEEMQKPTSLEVVKKELWTQGKQYQVRGQIYNPRKEPARDVRLSIEICRLSLGQNKQIIHTPKGEAVTVFDYIPAGATVEFIAISSVVDSPYESHGMGEVVFQEGKLQQR